jgi:hypothetical protein
LQRNYNTASRRASAAGRPATMPNTSGRRETFDAHEWLAPAVYQIENMSRR